MNDKEHALLIALALCVSIHCKDVPGIDRGIILESAKVLSKERDEMEENRDPV